MKPAVCTHRNASVSALPIPTKPVSGNQALFFEEHLVRERAPNLLVTVHVALILISLKKEMLYRCYQPGWHMISNEAKWPHGLMCPGVKQGCPDPPLTPGSFIRLCSRHCSIDRGHWRGHPLSYFSSIQLKHQLLNQCLVFIGTLTVLIDWQASESHNDQVVSLASTKRHSVASSDVEASVIGKKGAGNQVGVANCKSMRTHSTSPCALSLLLDPPSLAGMLSSVQVRGCLASLWCDFQSFTRFTDRVRGTTCYFYPSPRHMVSRKWSVYFLHKLARSFVENSNVKILELSRD